MYFPEFLEIPTRDENQNVAPIPNKAQVESILQINKLIMPALIRLRVFRDYCAVFVQFREKIIFITGLLMRLTVTTRVGNF